MSTDPFKPVLLTLPSLTPPLAVEVVPYGLTIHRIYLQPDGRTHDIVVGPESAKDYPSLKYMNGLIGRYANRLPVGSHTVKRHGVKATVNPEASENPSVSLHGGPKGFDKVTWALMPSLTSSTLFTQSELAGLDPHASAIFTHVSTHGDQGYPGKLQVEALVTLVAGDNQSHLGALVIVYRAKVLEDATGAPVVTPINLTQHWGFNLDASLRRGPNPSVLDHVLTMKASHTVDVDSKQLPTGSLTPIAGPHIHSAKKIRENMPEGGYDHFYVLKNAQTTPSDQIRVPLSEFKPNLDLLSPILKSEPGERSVVELSSELSGITVSFSTNQSGVQFYTNNLASPRQGARKAIHGGSGKLDAGDSYDKGEAAYLEFHEPIAAFLHPNLQTSEDRDTLITSDEIYTNHVRMDVKYISTE